MATVMVALSQDPARVEQAKALTAALPPERLLKALQSVNNRPDAAAALGTLTTVIPAAKLDEALASPGVTLASALGAAVEAIKTLVQPAQPVQPVQPVQPPPTAQFVGTASP